MSTTWNERVGERRRALNLTKTELAKRCGVSVPTAQQWESGEIEETSASNFDRLAEVLGVSVNWLRFGTYADDEDLMAGLTNTQRQTVKTLINTLREQNEEAVKIAEELKRSSDGV